MELPGGEGVGVVFVTTDDRNPVSQGVEMVKAKGVNPAGYPAKVIVLAISVEVNVNAIATHALPIEDTQRGMELASTRDDGTIKVILSFGATHGQMRCFDS